MRILMVSKTYPLTPECGGTGAMAQVIAEGLVQRGHQVLVLSSYRVYDAEQNGVSVRARLIMDQPAPDKMPRDWSGRDKLLWIGKARHNYAVVRGTISRFGPDLVYLNDVELLSGSVFAACVAAAVRCLWHSHDYILRDQVQGAREAAPLTVKQRLIQRLIRSVAPEPYFATPVIAVSRFLADEYCRIGWSPDLVKVVPNGLPEWFFGGPAREAPLPDDWPLLFVGRCVPDKGLCVLVEVLRLLKQRGRQPSLVMVGSFPDDGAKQAFLSDAVSAGVGDQIDYRGVLPRESLPDVYRQAACLLAPSLWQEPFGLMSTEAQACGTPVIASRVGGLPETLVDGVTGFLCEPGDAEAMVERVEQLHSDAALWKAMSAAASDQAAKRFGSSDKLDSIEEIIKRIAHAP